MESGNGAEAVDLASRFSDPIHLLITDVVMPQMNGRQLKEQFAQLHPETSILYMSGYTDDILAQYDHDQGTPFLEKPFTTETFIKQVNEILHRS
jgi:YesN/AraC family two-component response regulator